MLFIHAGVVGGEDAGHHWGVVVEHVVVLKGLRLHLVLHDIVVALLHDQLLMLLYEFNGVHHFPLHLLLYFYVASRVVGGAFESAIGVFGLVVVLAKVAAGGDAAGGEEGRGVVAEV